MSRRLTLLLSALGFVAGAAIALAPLLAPERWKAAYVGYLSARHGVGVDLLLVAVPPVLGLSAWAAALRLARRARSLGRAGREVSR